MARITLDLLDDEVAAKLGAMIARLAQPHPMLQEMGEYLIVSTKERFTAGIDPDGVPWAPNKPATLARKKGSRPLIGESKRLGSEILMHVDDDSLEVGSNLVYAAPQQRGAGKGQFGTTRRGAPIPWGDIVPRRFLGLSDDDERNLLDIASEYLEQPLVDGTP